MAKRKIVAWATNISPMIIRKGDSANLAGIVSAIAAVTRQVSFDNRQVVTALRTEKKRLKLILWNIGTDGMVTRVSSSGSGTDIASNIDIARGTKDIHIAAYRTSAGRLKLTSWRIDPSTNAPVLAGSSGTPSLSASTIRIIALDGTANFFLTAHRTPEDRLKLTSWQLNHDDSITQLFESSNTVNPEYIDEISLVQIQSSSTGSRAVTAIRTREGILKLIAWNISAFGDIARLGNTGQQGGKASLIRSMWHASLGQVVTAVKDSAGHLLLTSWQVSADGHTLTKTGDSDNQAGSISGNALMPRDYGALSAVRTKSGTLKLIGWRMSNTSGGITICRIGDSADQAGVASLITLCQDALDGSIPVVTSVRTESNALKLITWDDIAIANAPSDNSCALIAQVPGGEPFVEAAVCSYLNTKVLPLTFQGTVKVVKWGIRVKVDATIKKCTNLNMVCCNSTFSMTFDLHVTIKGKLGSDSYNGTGQVSGHYTVTALPGTHFKFCWDHLELIALNLSGVPNEVDQWLGKQINKSNLLHDDCVIF